MSQSVKYRLPEIIVIGPGRTGTTWLHRVLEGQVDLPYGVKETQFFHDLYHKGIDWYAYHFRYATGARKVVEVCPYLLRPLAPSRIKLHMPHCRFVATLRDPVDRVYSLYKWMRYYAFIRSGSFDEIMKLRPEFAGGNRYATHLKSWFDTFGRENVLVTFYDQLRAQPQVYLNGVTDFMGIDRIALSKRVDLSDDVNAILCAPKNRKLARRATALIFWLNSHQAYGVVNLLDRYRVWDFCHGRGEPFPRLTPEQDARMRQRYLPEVEAVEELLGVDLSAWKKPRAVDKREVALSAALGG